MAVDTRNKRASAIGLGVGPWLGLPLPDPDASVETGDRAHLLALYSGLNYAGVSGTSTGLVNAITGTGTGTVAVTGTSAALVDAITSTGTGISGVVIEAPATTPGGGRILPPFKKKRRKKGEPRTVQKPDVEVAESEPVDAVADVSFGELVAQREEKTAEEATKTEDFGRVLDFVRPAEPEAEPENLTLAAVQAVIREELAAHGRREDDVQKLIDSIRLMSALEAEKRDSEAAESEDGLNLKDMSIDDLLLLLLAVA